MSDDFKVGDLAVYIGGEEGRQFYPGVAPDPIIGRAYRVTAVVVHTSFWSLQSWQGLTLAELPLVDDWFWHSHFFHKPNEGDIAVFREMLVPVLERKKVTA